MAVPVACLHGTGLRAWSRSRTATSPAGPARRSRTSSQNGLAGNLGIPRDKVRAIWQVGPGSYGRNDADDCAMDCGVLAKAVGKPVRVQYTREQGTGWDPKGPASIHRARAAIDADGNVIAYEFFSKGFSRIDVQHQRATIRVDTLAGHLRGIDAEIGRQLRRAGRILRVRQQAHRVGDDRAAARPRLAAAHVASARSGRAADPLRQRIVHGRGGGGARRRSGRVPPAPRQGPARHRGDQGGGGEGRLEARGRRRARTRPATRSPAAASPMRSATARSSRSSPRSMSTADRPDLGAQVHRRARLRPDHQPGRPEARASKATSSRASAARSGKR